MTNARTNTWTDRHEGGNICLDVVNRPKSLLNKQNHQFVRVAKIEVAKIEGLLYPESDLNKVAKTLLLFVCINFKTDLCRIKEYTSEIQNIFDRE